VPVKEEKRLEYKQTNMKDRELTPMAAQYWELKREVGNDILLAFRLVISTSFSTTML